MSLGNSESQAKRLPYKDSSSSAPGIHFEQKNAVGQALRLPQFFDGSSSSGSRFAVLGTTGYLFRYNLRRQSRTGFGERAGLWSFQSCRGETSALDRSGCCFDARPSPRHRFANRCSRYQAWKFFGSTKTLDSPRTLDAAWNWQPGCFDRLLRSDESLHEKWLYIADNPVRAGLAKRPADWPYRIGLDD